MRTLAALAVMALLLLYVWERVDIVRVGYHIERLKSKRVLLQRERDELRVNVSTLTAPERIARAATEKLGMMPPQQGQVILVNVDPEPSAGDRMGEPEVRLAKSHGPGGMP